VQKQTSLESWPRLSKTEVNSHKSTHTGDHHRSKSKHGDDETRKNNNTTINQMAGTRSGKTNYKVGPEHQGRNARASMSKKRETIEPRATRFQTTEAADRQKRMRISDPSPPTPTKEQLVNLPRASRHSKPTCLHYGIDKRGRDMLYPDYFFCQHCEDYVQAMLLSSRKSSIKRNSTTFICQGSHTSFIHPTTKKSDRSHYTLFRPYQNGHDVEDATADATATATVTTNRAPRVTPTTVTVTPPTTVTVTPPTQSTQTNPSREAFTDILGERPDLVELQAKYARLLTQVERPGPSRVALSKLQKKYDDLLLRFQTYLAKTQDPKALITRAINLPFNDATEFDGSDAVVDSVIIRRKKVQKLVANVLMQTDFYDGLFRAEILKQA
jgi:hypothetical protein